MVLLNGKDQKIKQKELDEDSDQKSEAKATDQIRYQFRNCKRKKKKNKLHFQLCIKLRYPRDTKCGKPGFIGSGIY